VSVLSTEVLKQFGHRLRLAMVGGGLDSVIGETHQLALRADGLIEVVAGAMSIDPDIARASGQAILLAPERIYTDWRKIVQRETVREDGPDAVAIVTPPD
jgi:predicted dehydrogenase